MRYYAEHTPSMLLHSTSEYDQLLGCGAKQKQIVVMAVLMSQT